MATQRILSALLFGIGVFILFFGLRLLGAAIGILPMNEFSEWMVAADPKTFETTLDAVALRQRLVEQWALAPLSILLTLALMTRLPLRRRVIDVVLGSMSLAFVVSYGIASTFFHGAVYFALAALFLTVEATLTRRRVDRST